MMGRPLGPGAGQRKRKLPLRPRSGWLLLLVLAGSLGVQAVSSAQPTGNTLGFSVAIGTQGAFSYIEAGVTLPKLGALAVEVKARAMSCLNWVPTLDPSLTPPAFHPVAVGGALSFGGASPMFSGFFRAYGATEIFLGYTFTPYDSAIYGLGNLIGPNLTYALTGYFGVELFTSDKSSIFIDSGGGFKNLYVDAGRKTDPYVVAASWVGSGFTFRMGTKLYL